MNKLIKGAVAGAAGIALLLGGAGSFALWNGTATANAGVIDSGTLSLTPVDGSGTWTNTPYNSSTPVAINISTFKVVPGDTLTFTQKLNVTAIGNNLKATLALDPATIVATATDASAALRQALIGGMTVTIPSPLPGNFTAGTDSALNTFAVSGASALQTVTVAVTLPFPKTQAIDNTTQTGSVNVTKLGFTLRQN